jgi:hypothetical protein
MNDFAATLDAIITDPALRRDLDRAPEATLARLGFDVATSPAAAAGPALVAPPYVPVGAAVKPAMVAPPYVPVGARIAAK